MSEPSERGLSLRDLEVRYGGALALERISLDAAPGARIAVVGRNGAGKSTLLKAIAGVAPVTRGEVIWDGVDITRKPVHARVAAGIALVPEGRRTFGSLSVAENLRVGGFVAPADLSVRRESVYELFPPLRRHADTPAVQLSGGESQMLAIGQALMADPRLVLLDEPSIGLAPITVRSLLETMETLADRGITTILVEQSVRLATAFADTVYALARGRLVLVRAPGQALDETALRTSYFGTADETAGSPNHQ
jgi:branched-chain amino acid transport system ATP-binding protein